MASTFTVTEEELFNFESFCDSKYSDANCQKYGFFKIKLAECYAGQCSSLNDFLSNFAVHCQKKIGKTVLLLNPQSTTLFGHQNIQPTSAEKNEFILQALEASEDTFLQHFYSKVTAHPKVMLSDREDDEKSIRSRAAAKSDAFKKRQLYKEVTSMEGKKRCLEMAMSSEKILESPFSKCCCNNCNIQFTCNQKSSQNEEEDIPLLYSAGIEESRNNFLFLTKNFAMAYLCYQNMLADLDSVFGGVIMIPPTSVSRLTDALQRRGFYNVHRWCRNTLHHKFYIPLPQFFKEENIPFELVFQHAGEGIVVLPNTAHAGGNLGKNLAEACNFGTKKWIPYGCVAPNCGCMEDAVHADLADIVAVHEPKLLQAYLANEITNVVEDQYFKKSIVVPSKDMTCGCEPVSALHVHHDKVTSKRRVVEVKSRIKCPVCEVSWAYTQKRNMMAHILKYHSSRRGEEIVSKFIQQYSLTTT
ncbi:Lysine-specific demethylase 4E [Frankliniella fusca]|uniref:Lysine-specific demethylase 4E n=1 Tax=Frankliniella fusca TaxID=407009 RepID=A0AAE1H922_9NEOP|nr:Lysine-specific demethylase 4E [Frankliniella fusca]